MAKHYRGKYLIITFKITFVGLSILFLLYGDVTVTVNSNSLLKGEKSNVNAPATNGVIDIVYENSNSLNTKVELFNRYFINKLEQHIQLHLGGDILSHSNLTISKVRTHYMVRRGYVDGFYSYRTPVKNTLTFILSWKSTENDSRTHLQQLRQTLPVWGFYSCLRTPTVAKLGGWEAFSNGMSKRMCNSRCSENLTDLVHTLPDKNIGHLLDIYYEQVSYSTGCNIYKQPKNQSIDLIIRKQGNQFSKQTNFIENDHTKVISPIKKQNLREEDFEKQEVNFDILTAMDIVVGGCLISKESFIYTNQREVLQVNGCTTKAEVGTEHYMRKSRTLSFVNNVLFFKDEPENISIPEHNEIFTIEQQPNNENYYHLLVEKITKLSLFVPLLRNNPKIVVHTAPKSEYHIYLFFKVFGLTNKIISGNAKARIAYIPHTGMCYQPVVAGLQQSQYMFKKYIEENVWLKFFSIPRDTIVYIKRKKRQLHPEQEILTALSTYGELFNFNIVIFDDTRLPSLQETMLLFHKAALVIGPHGAGMANMLFSRPGTVIIEVQCRGYWARPCFRDMAFKLGMRYYGTVSSDSREDIPRDRCNKRGVQFNSKELEVLLNDIFSTIVSDPVR